MNRQDFDRLATNIEIMQLIFQHLNFTEQLKFAQVSLQMKYIFCNFIWKVDYAKIYIMKNPPNFHVTNETDLNKVKLTPEEFKEFLKLYSQDIKELNEKYDPRLDIRKFPNLISLTYSNMCVTKRQLRTVVRYCKNLEKFQIYACSNKNYDMFLLGRDLEIITILEMKNLKYLYLDCVIQSPVKYRHFHDLISKTNIKHLLLKYYLQCDGRFYALNNEYRNSLDELEIATTFKEEWWQRNFSTYLWHFENLIILTLNSGDNMDDDSLEILGKTCKKLKKLSINFIAFQNVTQLNLLTSLEELNLQLCHGLSHTNLRQILTQMNLVKFFSEQIYYEGTFENFVISEKIQYLHIDKLNMSEFKGAYEANENLSSLNWYNYENAMEPVSFKCPNLENLNIESGFIAVELVLQLTSLRTLSLQNPVLNMPWSYIGQLLQNHASLKAFSLENCACDWNSESAPTEAFKCAANIECIEISTEIFQIALDFWLDLVGKNPKIKFICSGIITKEFVRNFLTNKKFPSFFKILYIDGVKVACKDLRKNLDSTMDKINWHTYHPIQVAYDNKYGIIF